MLIKTSDPNSIKLFIQNLYLPPQDSHKGQNGKVLIIGGSSLFHAASIWAAETASHFVDIVHYASTEENQEIFLSLKKKFINGIIVQQKDLLDYVKEDDAILLGPGMIRGAIGRDVINHVSTFEEILRIKDEPTYTYYLTKYLIENFPNKKFVFDAGSLQIMNRKWLLQIKEKPILTPHQGEFEQLFKIKVKELTSQEKIKVVAQTAKKYQCIILLKAVVDIISDGKEIVTVEGGNAGLTKGGTGDVLAGLTTSFAAKNNSFTAAVVSSYLLKKTADDLYKIKGYWYNIDDIINKIPEVLKAILISIYSHR